MQEYIDTQIQNICIRRTEYIIIMLSEEYTQHYLFASNKIRNFLIFPLHLAAFENRLLSID